jgi:Skp family chaperone for outer membrane proteins
MSRTNTLTVFALSLLLVAPVLQGNTRTREAPTGAYLRAPVSTGSSRAGVESPNGVGYLDVRRVARESKLGRAYKARVEALNDQRRVELNAIKKNGRQALARGDKEAPANFDEEASAFTAKAQHEVLTLQKELEAEFDKKLMPIINEVALAEGLNAVFSQTDRKAQFWGKDGQRSSEGGKKGKNITEMVRKRMDEAWP